MFKSLNSPLFLALDVDTKEEALALVKSTCRYIGGYKLGPRLIVKYGESIISDVAKLAPVFVDNKYYDIPNTMLYAVKASFQAGASFVSIHASCGIDALKLMAVLEKELNRIRPFKILCVTILTSFSQSNLPVHHNTQPIGDQVFDLVSMVRECGLNGIVCSSEELSLLKPSFSDLDFVTPGIRLPGDDVGDQKRVMGPKEAMNQGASALVVGRPIYKSPDPALSAKNFYSQLELS